jgi:NADH dehydrogenase
MVDLAHGEVLSRETNSGVSLQLSGRLGKAACDGTALAAWRAPELVRTDRVMANYGPLEDRLVVLIGGSGFLGTYLAEELLDRGARLRIADRHPERAIRLRPLANLGQIQFARCDVTDRRSLETAMQGADAAVYLVGSFAGDLFALQAQGAGAAAELAAANGASSFVYVSAIGADPGSDSGYAATKGRGEGLVREAFPAATVLRPSVLFGEDDKFLNMFASYVADWPAVPVFGASSKLQPLWVDDAAEAIANALADPSRHGAKTYEIAGPEAVTMIELNQRIARAQGRKRHFVKVPDGLAAFFAMLPLTPMNTDQWKLLKRGSVPSGRLPGVRDLGVTPKPLGLFLDRWMIRYRKHGRFGDKRLAPGATPATAPMRFSGRGAPPQEPRT